MPVSQLGIVANPVAGDKQQAPYVTSAKSSGRAPVNLLEYQRTTIVLEVDLPLYDICNGAPIHHKSLRHLQGDRLDFVSPYMPYRLVYLEIIV